jgi:glyoxylase-like metal-dependent hydrolase (beta-lactamase superfamily II)
MNFKGSLIIFLFCEFLYSFSGCNSRQSTFNNVDSQKVDSLIKIQKVNDRTIIVNFGYDAVTAIKSEQGIVLIDAGISTALTAKYRIIIENKFLQDDYKYVINTHGHPDHIGGNSIFSQAKVVGHENCRNEVSERLTNPEKLIMSLWDIVEDYEQKLQQSVPNTSEWDGIFTQKIRYMGAYFDVKNNISVKIPDITFSDSMKLDLGDTTIEMIYFGKFHSNSDIVIYVPEISMIFIGDLFSKYGRPGIGDSPKTDVVKYLRAIRWIDSRMNNIEKVIDGHGQILSRDDLKDFNRNILTLFPGQ